MKKKIKTLSAAIAVMLIVATSVPALATTVYAFELPSGKVWVSPGNVSRSKDYSYVLAACLTVYPESGDDNFHKIRCRLTYSGEVISEDSSVTLTEGAGNEKITLKQGYLGLSSVSIEFSGNSNAGAFTNVFYDGL